MRITMMRQWLTAAFAAVMLCASFTAVTPSAAIADGVLSDEKLLNLVENKWEPRMAPYVNYSSERGYKLDWEGFRAMLRKEEPRLAAHFDGTHRIPKDPDVQAIRYCRESIPVMNQTLRQMALTSGRTAGARSAEDAPPIAAESPATGRMFPQAARTLATWGCWTLGTNKSFTSLELQGCGDCGARMLACIQAGKGLPIKLPWPLSKFLNAVKLPKKLTDLAGKAKEHYEKCGGGCFKVKYYPLQNKWNIGC